MLFSLLSVYGIFGGILSVIDLRKKVLPNKILYPAVVVIHAVVLFSVFTDNYRARLFDAFLGTAVMFLSFLFLALIVRNQLGGGDVKFAAFIGPFVGFFGGVSATVIALLITFVLGGLVALITYISKRDIKETIPYGPVMFVAGWITFAIAIQW